MKHKMEMYVILETINVSTLMVLAESRPLDRRLDPCTTTQLRGDILDANKPCHTQIRSCLTNQGALVL